MKKPVILVLVITAVLAAAIAFYFHVKPDANPDVVKVSGNIELTSVDVSFKVPGRVLERTVNEGETVKAGQLLARLDGADLSREAAIRRGEADAVRAALRELEAGSRNEEIGQAEAALAAVEAEAKRLRDDFRRQQELFSREVVPKQKLDAALAARDASQAQVRQAREALSLLRKGPRRERIDQARARLREAEAVQALADERLGYAVLISPVAGIVTAKNVEAGEQVAVGTPVVTIGDMANVWVRAYIPETELGRVKTGQKVRVRTDTWPDRVYEGQVSFISPEAEFTPKNVQTRQERVKLVYRIKVTIPNPKGELKAGMPADAEILTK